MLVEKIPSSSYYEAGKSSNMDVCNNNGVIGGRSSIAPFMMCSLNAGISPETKTCRSHKDAERERRHRINAHIATLRTLLLPNLTKTDKASVLQEVVRQVRELKKATSESMNNNDASDDDDGGCKLRSIPSDIDEVKVCKSENDDSILIATLCVEDRPDLMMDLTRALNSIKGKVVRVEMSTIGGRVKIMLWLEGVDDDGEKGGGAEGFLKRALNMVVDKPSSSCNMGYGQRMHPPY